MPARQAPKTKDTYNAYKALWPYRFLLWGKESTIKTNLAANRFDKQDLVLFEVACGIVSVLSDTPWYRIDKKISQFCVNAWMRFFRKNVVRLLLTEGCVPQSKAAQDYCKPMVEALLETYHNIHPLSPEQASKQATLLQTAKTLKWDNIVQVYDQNIPNKAVSNEPASPPAQVEPIKLAPKPSESSETKPSLLPAFEASYTVTVEPYAENEQRGGGELRPHNPNFSTKTATSHYLNIKMVD